MATLSIWRPDSAMRCELVCRSVCQKIKPIL
jgi:hypothetical protein